MSQDEKNPMTLQEAVEYAIGRFDDYAEQHQAKCTDSGYHKAAVNRTHARKLRASLEASRAPHDPQPVRQMYFLVCGEIVFRGPEETDPPCQIRLNCVVMSRDGRFPVSHIAQAQQTLQKAFHQRFQDDTLVVMDCPIINILPLGHFTHEEFNNLPMPGADEAAPEVARTPEDAERILRDAGVTIMSPGKA